MKVLWCWRCQLDIPMLDEEEFEQVMCVYRDVTRDLKEARRRADAERSGFSMKTLMAPACAEYARLTGFPETNINAVLHHRLSLYGPPCGTCGKPLRTPQARYCAACGALR